MADTGEVLSNGSSGSGFKYGRNGIQETFSNNQANSRQRKRVNKNGSNAFKPVEQAGEHLKVTPQAPFRNAGSNQGMRNRNGMDGDYFGSGNLHNE